MSFQPVSALQKAASRFAGDPVWRGGHSDIVATLYEDGVIIAVSRSAREVIGAAGDLVGRSLLDFVAREDRKAVASVLKAAAEGGVYADPAKLIAPFTLLRVRRAAAPAEINIRPIGRGRLSALIRRRSLRERPAGKVFDISPPSRAPEAPSVDLMADLAHEMKTPLNAIMGFADAMRAQTYGPIGADERGSEKYAEYVEHIHAAGAHLTALISAAQDYAKTRQGKYQIERVDTDPVALAAECIAMIRNAADKVGLALNLRTPENLDSAMLDERAVKQILVNLLSNAVKFTKEGEVELSIEEQDGEIEFVVRDTGIGMNATMLAKLGGRYSDTHRTGVNGTGGSGLGLSLAFDLARLHGGALTINSKPDHGTTAKLTLPLREVSQRSSIAAIHGADIQSQLDRVNAFRAERARSADAA